MIEILKAILFGIVEGITEWLPISSTGHMILLNEFIHLGVSPEFYELFQVVIQLGAILAVVVIYFKNIWPLKKKNNKIVLDQDILSLWGKILVACIPAAVLGLLLDDWLDEHFYNAVVVSLALIIYGIIFIVIENKRKEMKSVSNVEKGVQDITYKQALQIGGFQLLALIPGTSRSGSTILGGLLMGLDRSVIAEFTFFLAIPVMAGASLLKLAKYVLKVGLSFSGLEIGILLTACIVAYIVSILVIKFLMNYIRKHDFKVFGWYRIILGLLVLLYFFIIK
ncbi:MAG: undecaprenyl-diphosphate phosphatase [Bacilli bacterium]|nr:undecaprenyl-diphosphate phosphatase [Bacilli bacterium]